MNWLDRIVRGRVLTVEAQQDALLKLIASDKVTYRRCQEMCAATRDIWLRLFLRYMNSPGGDSLINASALDDDRQVPFGEVPETSIYRQAANACAAVLKKLDSRSSCFGEAEKAHVEEMKENILQRKAMLEVLLRPNLTYGEKLDEVRRLGDASIGRVRNYPQAEQLEAVAR